MGIIAGDDDPMNNPTPLEGMDLQDYGFTTDGFWIHMRLENAVQSVQRTGVCSSTLDFDSNAWQDSYRQHWGNALLIWLRE
jgi:hypothetical protein